MAVIVHKSENQRKFVGYNIETRVLSDAEVDVNHLGAQRPLYSEKRKLDWEVSC